MHRVVMGAAAAFVFFVAPAAAQSSPHRIEVELGEGVASVRETLRFPRAGVLTELLEAHLPVPPGAVLRSLTVCAGSRCRRGRPGALLLEVFQAAREHRAWPGQAPLAQAFVLDDALHVYATQGFGADPTTITLEWAAPTSSAGAREYLPLPLRDQLTSSPRIEVSSPSLDALGVHEAGELHELARVVVGTRRAPPARRSAPVHVAILVDVSPSTREHADALRRLTEATLRSLPRDALVTVVSFASRATLVSDAQRPAELLGGDIEVYRPAGTRARPGRAWALASRSRLVDDVVWLGDGLLSRDPAADDALARLVDSGARLHAFSVTTELSGELRSAVMRSRGVAGQVEHTRGSLLDAALASMWAPIAPSAELDSPTLRRARVELSRGLSDALVAVDAADLGNVRKELNGGRARFRAGGGVMRRTIRFRCGLHADAFHSYGAMSREVVRRAIRRSVAPRVRGCFQSARGGRPGWSARVDARVVVIRGEVVSASASGGGEALDQCVADAFDDFELPAQDAAITLHYPFVARPIPLPPAEDLGLAAPELDALLTRFEPAPAPDAWLAAAPLR